MKNVYPTFFTKTTDCILVEVPDLGILTEGKDMNDAINMARDAIKLMCVSIQAKNECMPNPTDISQLIVANGVFAKEGFTVISLVDMDCLVQ